MYLIDLPYEKLYEFQTTICLTIYWYFRILKVNFVNCIMGLGMNRTLLNNRFIIIKYSTFTITIKSSLNYYLPTRNKV